jgi:hypothetical protein
MCTFGEFEPDPKLLMEMLPLPLSPTTLTRLWRTTSSFDELAATARHALAHGAASLRTGLQASLRRSGGGGGAFPRGMAAPWPPPIRAL